MNAIDFVRTSLQMSQEWILGMAQDMQSAPLTFPTPQGGNHPLWCLGHLAFAEGNLVHRNIKGVENPLAHWEKLFDQGTTPVADPSVYPSMEEVLAKFHEMRADTLALLDTLTDADLDKPSHVPEEMRAFFGTVGQCLAAVAIHFGFHGGQIADAHRAAGRAPLMG